MLSFQFVQTDRQTDGQTDGQTDNDKTNAPPPPIFRFGGIKIRRPRIRTDDAEMNGY